MLPDPERALDLIKPAVRQSAPYTLEAPQALWKLNQNEAPWDVPPAIKREILDRAAALDWNRYPAFAPRALLGRLARRHDWDPAGVLTGNGSNEVLQAALAATICAGGAVVAPSPSFSLYRLLVGANEGRYFPVPLGPGFTYDLDAIIETARREHARAIVLCSPNNPTGSVLPDGAIPRLLADTDALLFCDEAYQDFGGPSAVRHLRDSARVIVFRTFSKAMGFAGLRFGYALAHPAVVEQLRKTILPYNVNLLTLAAADLALDHWDAFAARVRETMTQRDRLAEGLAAIGGLTIYPSAANFILVRCEARPAAEVFERLHRDHGILLRDVSSGPGLAGCLRITVGTAGEVDATLAGFRAIFPARAGTTGG